MASSATTAPSSSKSSPLYRAFPIPPESKCIRLLKVLGCSSLYDDGGPIESDLSIVDLDQHPPFTALSYVWHPEPTPPKLISCGGSTINVPDNCYSALVHLRRKLGTLTIWIDSICIDQDNEDEKSQQIPLMGDIYSGAQVVHVWLGAGTRATDRAMNFLARAGFCEFFFENGDPNREKLEKPHIWAATWCSISTSRSALKTRMPIHDKSSNPQPSGASTRSKDYQIVSSASFDDLGQLLSRPWVRRIWTYQEIILATNPVVLCGDESLAWSVFAAAIIFLDIVMTHNRPLAPTLSTWKKLVLSRERVIDPSEREKLLDYGRFVQEISHNYIILRIIRSSLYFFCFLMFGAFIALMAYFGVVNNGHKDSSQQDSSTGLGSNLTVSAASSIVSTAYASATACAKSCSTQDPSSQNECVGPCFQPDETATSALSVLRDHAMHYDYRTALPLLLLPAVILGFIFLGRLMTKHGYFPQLNAAIQRMRRQEDENDDLVDCICTRSATNPKDMAFGIRSVLSRLMHKSLPAPDYAKQKGDIYNELVAHVLDLTRSLQFLVPAALQSLPRNEVQPSWVPDWSADFPRYWLKPYLSFQMLKDAAPESQPIWQLDAQRNVLSVYGRQICTAESFLDFQVTSETYYQREDAAHLRNIETMLQISQICGNSIGHDAPKLRNLILNPLNHPDFPDEIGITSLHAYFDFLWDHRKKEAADVLALLSSTGQVRRFNLLVLGFINSFGFAELFRIHVCICNSMARTGRKLFRTNDLQIISTAYLWDKRSDLYRYGNLTRPHVEPGTFPSVGICTGEVRAGDLVVIISGLPMPLVVRRSPTGSERLVSPAIVVGAMEGQAWKADDEKTGDRRILEVFNLS